MHSELRLTPLPTPQFWDIQDAGWPTGNDTSGHVEVPLDSHPAPSEACSVAAKLSLCPLPGFTPGLARDRGMFTKQDASRASLTCVTERRGHLSGTLGYRGEGHFVNLMFSPAVSSVFYFFLFFQSIYQIQTTFLFLTVWPGQWKSTPESISPTPCLPSLFPTIQSLHSGHSYLSMMYSLSHGSLTPFRTPHLSWEPTVSPGTSWLSTQWLKTTRNLS